MSSPVKTLRETETVQQVCKIMIENDIGSVVIVSDKSDAPLGIVTERDIVRHIAERPISFMAPASQIMSQSLITIHPNGSIRDALQLMQSRNIRRLPVVIENGKLMAGILTDKDVFRFISKNISVASGIVSEEVLASENEIGERFNVNLLEDILHRK